jgi:hypothetical protein
MCGGSVDRAHVHAEFLLEQGRELRAVGRSAGRAGSGARRDHPAAADYTSHHAAATVVVHPGRDAQRGYGHHRDRNDRNGWHYDGGHWLDGEQHNDRNIVVGYGQRRGCIFRPRRRRQCVALNASVRRRI